MATPQFRKSIASYLETRRAYASRSIENESSVRFAFPTLLDQTARPFRWTTIPEHPRKAFGGRLIRRTAGADRQAEPVRVNAAFAHMGTIRAFHPFFVWRTIVATR